MQYISDELATSFQKNFRLKFPCHSLDLFPYYIDLYDEMYHTKEKLSIFMDAVNSFESNEAFFKRMKEVRESLVDNIKLNSEYQEFKQRDMSSYQIVPFGFKKPPYNKESQGKWYMSIDLKEANVQALNEADKRILKANTFDKFIDDNLPNDSHEFRKLIKEAKQFREVVFGQLNSERIVAVERYIMQNIAYMLFEEFSWLNLNTKLVTQMHDELIFEVDEHFFKSLDALNSIQFEIRKLGYRVHLEIFQLKSISKTKPWFVKEQSNGCQKLIGVPNIYIPKTIKELSGLKVVENDLFFDYDDAIAKFLS
ncbi:MAG: hypothetical protein RSC93_02475 [Erysipelotrichaceae bacterium]